MEQAQAELGVDIAYLESDDATDYAPNIQAFLDEGCDLIITVGFNLAADTAAAACANPTQLFAILDEGPAYYPGSAWADGEGNALCDFSNVRAVGSRRMKRPSWPGTWRPASPRPASWPPSAASPTRR